MSGNHIPVAVKEGETVLLPDYGGMQVKLDDKEYDPTFSLPSIYTHMYISYGSFDFRIRPCLIGQSIDEAHDHEGYVMIHEQFYQTVIPY